MEQNKTNIAFGETMSYPMMSSTQTQFRGYNIAAVETDPNH